MTTPTVRDTASPPAVSTREDIGTRALVWWQRLKDPARGDPGTLARLRRARTPLDALGIRAAASLTRRVGGASATTPEWWTRAALDLARVLAHVKEHNATQHPMRAAGWKRFAGDRKETEAGEDRPLLAEARFKRLLQTGEEEKVAAFIRLIALLGGTVKVDDLARDFLRWTDPVRGDRVREHWAFLYYAAGEAAPPIPDDSTLTAAEDDDE